jgi:hypothetical protein
MIQHSMKVRIDPKDKLIVPSYVTMMGFFCAELFVVADLASRFKHPYIGWQSVVGLIAMILAQIGLSQLYWRVTTMIELAHDSSVKLTLTDTGKEGLDIDLTTDRPVIPTKEQQ